MNARDIRECNIMNLSNAADCEILLEELDHAANQIEEDIDNGFGNADWERKAQRALAEVLHKGKLAQMKLEALSVGSYPDHVRYAVLFHTTAIRVLSPEEVQKIKDDSQMKTWRD